MMLGRAASGLVATWALTSAALGASYTMSIDIRAQQLPAALQDLSRQTSIELLFDRNLVGGRRSPAIRGKYTPEDALRHMLQGTDLKVRQARSGALIIEQQAAPVLAQPDAPVPEILVIGTRSHNSDIRRLESDVQPYRVISSLRLVQAHRGNIDEYFRSRVTQNTEVLPPTLLERGETISEIDLRGLGPEATLVLVDGRRMPDIPASVFGLRQPDLNAIPLHAIERIETLTGTAGGIFGFGALGGAVNVVLARDYRGVDVHMTGGITSRGDAKHIGLEARVGFTPDHGATDVMIYFSRVRSEPLLSGERNYLTRDRTLTARFAPTLLRNSAPLSAAGNSVGVFGSSRSPLTFTSEFGGGSLGSDFTFLPAGFNGTRAELVAALREHAGLWDTSLSPAEAATDLGSNPATSALIVNVRHRFGSGIEAYADALILRNRGRYVSHVNTADMFLAPGSPNNPFNQFVLLTVPVAPRDLKQRNRFDSSRYTAGIVAGLPFGWRGTAEVTFGRVRVEETTADHSLSTVPIFPGPDLDPLGNWDRFQEAAAGFTSNTDLSATQYNHYREQSLRFAGPLFKTQAGPTTLTVLAERRREKIPSYTATLSIAGQPSELFFDSRSTRTRSLYAELKSRVFRETAPVGLLDQLELQLAVRHDHEDMDFSRFPGDPLSVGRMHPSFSEIVYTAGAKASPFRWLMLRGSYATGEVPPPPPSLIERRETTTFSTAQDPKRGGQFVTTDGPYLSLTQGSPDLRTIKASTLSIGAVLTPLGDRGPRLSLDYSRIRKHGDVYDLSEDLVLAHEDMFPDRVMREPLTEADRARGYTGGRITMIDARATNATNRKIDAIDGNFDWPLALFGGRLRAYGVATLQLHNKQKGLFEPSFDQVGFLGGPLKWRANGGVDWAKGPTSLGANLQYFGKYRIYPPGLPDFLNDQMTEIQGSKWVKAQAYLDLYASRRFHLSRAPGGDVTVDFGINNVLDKSPPRESSFAFLGPGYSRYGDPRRRRFELVIGSRF